MKKFMFLHLGFEKPTPEIMGAWEKWFESIADRQVDRGGLPGGREISHSGTRELPFEKDSITGYTVIQAESLDDFDGENLLHQFRQNRRLVPRASADLQDPLFPSEPKRICHIGNDVRLGNGLAVTDGERAVGVGLLLFSVRDKLIAWDLSECG